MATINIQGFSSAVTTTTNSTSLTISRPGLAAVGELMVTGVAYILGQTFTTLSGWTLAKTQAGTGGVETKLFYRVVDGSEGGTFTWSYTTTGGASLVAMVSARFSGTAPTPPLGVTAGTGNGGVTSLSPNALTGAASTSLGIHVCGVRPDAAGDPVLTNASGNGWTADSLAKAVSATTSDFDAAVALSYNIGTPTTTPSSVFSTTAACEYGICSAEFLVSPYADNQPSKVITRQSVMMAATR